MYRIIAASGHGTENVFMSGLSESEAREICDSYNYEFMDENGFVWDMWLEEE